MTAEEMDALLLRLGAAGVSLAVEGDRLRVRADRPLPSALIDEVTRHKPALLARLRAARLQRAPPARSYPLTSAQRRLYALHQLDPSSLAYQLADLFEARVRPDLPRLEQALRAVIARHEALRTRFVIEDGGPVQQVSLAVPFALEQQRAGPDWARKLEARPFDLAQAPLLRARWVECGDGLGRLLVETHHIVCDGSSRAALYADLARAYAGDPLPPLPLHAKDFAVWQQAHLEGEAGARVLQRWLDALEPAPPPLVLPLDHPRSGGVSFEGDRLRVLLDRRRVAQLRQRADAQRATVPVVLLALFGLLLRRFGAGSDFTIGLPIDGRAQPALDGVIGMFVNTLPIRLQPRPELSCEAWIGQVRDKVFEALELVSCPLEAIVTALGGPRDPARTPLIGALFSYFQSPPLTRELGLADGAVLHEQRFDPPAAKLDLSLLVEDQGDQLVLELEYAAALFERSTIARLLEHFQLLVGAALDHPTTTVGALAPLPDGERQRLLQLSGRAQVVDRPAITLGEAIARTVAAHGPSMAVISGAKTLDYRELDRRARWVAHRLQAAGIGRGDRVALLLERSSALATALLGALYANATFVPLDPDDAPLRRQHLLRESGARVVLTVERFAAHLPLGAPRLTLDEACPEGAPPEPRGGEPGSADDILYILYTSGSTGTPKGVALSHRAVLNRLWWGVEALGFGPTDVWLQKTPYTFDVAMAELFSPLLVGGTVVMLAPGAQADPRALAAAIEGHGVTTVHFVPSMLAPFLREVGPGRGALGRLRRVLASGEALGVDHARAFFATFGRAVELHNLYGPTETAIEVLHHHVTPEDREIPIGVPLPNVRAYVLDPSGELAPEGVAGELAVAGVQLADRYLDRPRETEVAFGPAAQIGEDRAYRTGDLVRWDRRGRLLFLGRRDDQLKIRGHRIELAEIRLTLAQHPQIRHAEVGVTRSPAGDPQLLACAVADGATAPLTLLAWLAERLPGYMVPSRLVLLPAIPRRGTGKVDWALVLPHPAPDAGAPPADAAPIEGDLATEIAQAWRGVLGRPPTDLDQDFFLAGGHSLLALELLHRVRARALVDIPLRVLLERPTVRGLAGWIDRVQRGSLAVEDPAPGLDAALAIDAPEAPLSFAQESLFFLWRLRPDATTYLLPYALWIDGALDRSALDAAVRTLGQRHAALRTQIVLHGDAPVQVVHPRPEVLRVESLAATSRPEEAAHARLDALAATPIDLLAEPLFTAVLLELGPDRAVLFLGLHHIIADGWSIGVLLAELEAGYAAARAGQPPLPLPPAPAYTAWALWQRRRLDAARLGELVTAWQTLLRDPPRDLGLPTERPGRTVARGCGARITLTVPADLAARLRAIGRQEGATLFVVVLAAVRALLMRHARQDTFAIGVPCAHRDAAALARAVGLFVGSLPIVVGGDPEASFRHAVRAERDAVSRALELRELPFDRLVDALGVPRRPGENPLFGVFFDLQPAPSAPRWAGTRRVHLEELAGAVPKFDLHFSFEDTGGALEGEMLFDRAALGGDTAHALADHARRLLAAIVEDPEAALASLPMVGRDEAERLAPALDTHRRPVVPIPRRFQAAAARAPQAIAIRHASGVTRYGDLAARAATLAAHLRRQGVASGEPVLVLLRRQPQLVVALLGVSMAGAAFVPVDPRNPPERVRRMADDAGARRVVTERALDRDLGALQRVDIDDVPAGEADAAPAGEGDSAEQTAYVLFTSGSRGRPKGVEISHRAASAFIDWALDHHPPEALVAVLAATSIGFDLAIFELFATLSAGGTIVLVEDGISAPDHPDYDAVTLINTVPSVARALLENRRLPRALVLMNLAGEPLAPELADALLHAGVPRLFDLYGPTEATTYATCAERTPGEVATIGRAIGSARVLVLDDRGRRAGVGMSGELAIAGPCLATGYAGQPAETRQRFVTPTDPEIDEARLYMTGDRGRFLPDGRLVFEGRIDDQLKWHGFRIEPGEIIAALGELSAVAEAAVALRRTRSGDDVLCAYVAVSRAISVDELRHHLRARLPSYAIPPALLLLETLPRNERGKIDRRALDALPLPEESALLHQPPSTPAEQVLAEVWCEVLAVDRVSADDNFFALGGHSLSAMRVAARAAQRLGRAIPLALIFEHPVLSQLAAAVSRSATAGRAPGAADHGPGSIEPLGEEAAPLSSVQQHLARVHRVAPSPALLNMSCTTELVGPLDVPALRRSFTAMVARHPILRSTVVPYEGQDYLVANDAPTDTFRLMDASSDALLVNACQQAVAPFDLDAGPYVRLVVARRAPDRHLLILAAHHIVGDEWSLDQLERELIDGYREPSAPPPLVGPTYFDYARWEDEARAGGVFERSLAWWSAQLARPWSPLRLPWRESTAGPPISIPFHARAPRSDHTPFQRLLAALMRTLPDRAGGDLRIATNVARRHRADWATIIGPLLDTTIIRASVPPDLTPHDALDLARARVVEATAHAEVPFAAIAAQLGAPTDLCELAPVFLLVQHQERGASWGAPLHAQPFDAVTMASIVDSDVHPYRLVLSLVLGVDGVLSGRVVARAVPDERGRVESWVRELEFALGGGG